MSPPAGALFNFPIGFYKVTNVNTVTDELLDEPFHRLASAELPIFNQWQDQSAPVPDGSVFVRGVIDISFSVKLVLGKVSVVAFIHRNTDEAIDLLVQQRVRLR